MVSVKKILSAFYAAETAYFQARARGEPADPADWLRWAAPGFVLTTPPDLPWGGVYNGHQGLVEWATKALTMISDLNVANPAIFYKQDKSESDESQTPNLVDLVVRGDFTVIIKGTNTVFRSIIVQLVTIDTEAGVVDKVTPITFNAGELARLLGEAF